MYKYQRILHWSDEDEAWIVEVPELPGCKCDGATQQEALINSETVIKEWIDAAKLLGREVPSPEVYTAV